MKLSKEYTITNDFNNDNLKQNAFNSSLTESYPTPKKLYDIKNDHAYWPEDSEDYIWWDSEAKSIDNYANSYKIKLSTKDYLDLTTKKGADYFKIGDRLGDTELKELDIDELNKELHQPIFLIVSFKDNKDIAYVVGHEGRHRVFALMNAGIKTIDVQMKCNEYDTSFDKYNPFDLKDFYLIGQYNKNVKVNVKNAIPMSWAKHKEIRPNLTESSNTQLLYHGTTLRNAINILNDNKLQPFAKNYYNIMVSKKPSISFTRDLNFAKNMLLGDHPVIFVLDKNKLQNHYKLIPVSDNKNNVTGPKVARFSENSKAEEICETPITDLNNYMIKILCKSTDIDTIKKFSDLPIEPLSENLSESVNNDWKNNLFRFLKTRFQANDSPIKRSFLLPDGTFIGTPDGKPHYYIDNSIFNSFFGYVGELDYDNFSDEEKEIFRTEFNLSDPEIFEIYDHIKDVEAGKLDGSPLLSLLGCIRLNGDQENFCEIPSKEDVNNLTQAQYSKLEDWLYDFAYDKNTIEINIAGNYLNDIDRFAEYDPKNPKYIISRIKLYYTTQKLLENLLLEMNRTQLIQKSKRSDNYKDQSKGRNRWERRNKSKIATRVDQYNKIDMNKFFKDDELKVGINVKGETDDYVVTIRYNGVLREIQDQIKRNNNTLEFKCVLIALQRVFNSGNVFVSCSCLHPTTKIKLLDGTLPTVEELKTRFDSGEKLYTYSVDDNGDFKPGIIENVWVTKTTTDFIKITLDNNKEIITTPEHLYMLRDGTYMQASQLKENDSLMPLYFNERNGYETIKSNTSYRYKSTYKQVAQYFKSNEISAAENRSKPEDNMSYKVAIHHKDFNKSNNNPENLKIMTAKEHWLYHANLCGKNKPITDNMRRTSRENAKKRNANPTEAMLQQRKKFIEAGKLRNYDEDRKKQQSEIMRKTMTDYYNNISEDKLAEIKTKRSIGHKKAIENGCLKTEKFKIAALNRGKDMHTPEREALIKAGVIRYYSDPKNREDHKRKLLETKILNMLKYLIDNHLELTDDNYELVRRKNKNSYPRITKRFSNINEAVSYFELNHKVKKVEHLTLSETPVYDLSIKDFSNFLVDGGVILHNCPDWKFRQSYHATRDGYNSGDPEIRASDITNPGDTKGAGCKHVNLVLGNVDWLMKICSVINNYIHYMKDHFERKYADLIFPKLFGIPYQKAVQLNLLDTDDDLSNNPDEIKLSNQYGRDRTRFRSDVRINNMRNFGGSKKEKPDDPNQVKLDLGLTRNADNKEQAE